MRKTFEHDRLKTLLPIRHTLEHRHGAFWCNYSNDTIYTFVNCKECLEDICQAVSTGEMQISEEFLTLYMKLVTKPEWRQELVKAICLKQARQTEEK